MRRYETTYILRPNLGEDQFTEIIERTNAIVTGDGGTIINLERWGNRKLAYEIRKESFGQYVYFDYAAPPSTIQEMERIFRIDDRVLRFLTVKLADDIDEETIAGEKDRAAALAAERASREAEEADADTEGVEAAPADVDVAEESNEETGGDVSGTETESEDTDKE